MKFRLQRPSTGACTTIDHVYPRSVRGAYCACEQRRYGIEPPQRAVTRLDADGRVYRPVWRVLARQAPNRHHPDAWVYNVALRGCGHIILKRTPTPTLWVQRRVRCRMCERIFNALNAETQKQDARKARHRAQEMKWIKHQMKQQQMSARGARSEDATARANVSRLRIRIPRSSIKVRLKK